MGKRRKTKKRDKKKGLKIGILVIEILVILVLAFVIAMLSIPNSKMKLLKSVTSCSIGRGIIGCFLGSDYEEYLQDDEFDEDNIVSNVELSGEYTNIALFGVDLEESRTDTMIVLSINNETEK
jgi:anionic cell wall polymer biosynthesis LytR-Cps2A-Psr (LCP) family protein